MTLLAILALAAGTYGLRVSGPVLRRRYELSEQAQSILSVSAAVLLCALIATSALNSGHGFAGWARPAGVLVGGGLALRRAPFLVCVLAAVATAALLRFLGLR